MTEETLSTEPVEVELTTEETLYSTEPANEEVVDEVKAETQDSEDEPKGEPVNESEEEAKPGETEEAIEGEKKEVEYKLELKENSLLDNSMLEDIEAFARENNMSEDVASGMLSKQEELLMNFVAQKTDQHEAIKDGWRDEVIKDKQLGGDNLNRTIENARKVVTKFGSEEFIGMLKDSGYGDNIEVVRFFSKIGSMMSDDSLITGKEFGGEKSVEDYFYGSN